MYNFLFTSQPQKQTNHEKKTPPNHREAQPYGLKKKYSFNI